MLNSYDQTATKLLNIIKTQKHNSDLFFDLRGWFHPLTNRLKLTSDIDSWRRRQSRGRVGGNTIDNGGNIIPVKGGGCGISHGIMRSNIDK